MGRKKRKATKPWCWYCNREFDDEKILLQHQKAKHFKCHVCHKKLFTGPGLQIHCMQVHKENIDKVPNALKGRDDITLEICGMDNIPEEDLIEHEKQKGLGDPDDEKDTSSPLNKVLPPGTIHGPLPHMPPAPPSHFMMPPPPMGMMNMMPFWNPMIMGGQMGSTSGPPPPHMMPNPSSQPQSLMSIPPPPLPAQNSQNTQQPSPQPPMKPLFPSGANPDNQYGDTVTRKSSDDHNDLNQNVKKTKIEAVGSGSKIIHPDEDISLEEFRANHQKYKYFSPQNSATTNTATVSSPAVRSQYPQTNPMNSYTGNAQYNSNINASRQMFMNLNGNNVNGNSKQF